MKKDSNSGKFVKFAKYVDKICNNCEIAFSIKESDLKYGRGKCCSRKCVDEYKKKSYSGENNPMYGKKLSDIEKRHKSVISTSLWKSDSFRNKIINAQQIFFERASKDGTWERASKKREETFFNKTGNKHNWNGKYGYRKCDLTFYNEHNKTSIEHATTYIRKHFTSIEKKTAHILNTQNIKYIPQYKLENYSYDFFLPEYIILIECDGDYWHGFGKLEEQLDEIQKKTHLNDIIKNRIAANNQIPLLRFWEHEIHSSNFERLLLHAIWQK